MVSVLQQNEGDASRMTSSDKCAADGSWERLDQLESIARRTISRQLDAFRIPFQKTYEAGVIVPVLRANGRARIDVRSAALFFKRVLNDLRSVWVLLQTGYTSQAASVTAALHENALATICLTISTDNIESFLRSDSGEIPWGPMQMCKMIARNEGYLPPSKDYENTWRSLYAHYGWLCQSKHPTACSVIHDTTASEVNGKGYVVMALPNVRLPDIPFKATVAIMALHRTLDAIDAFASALGYSGKLPQDYDFASRVATAKNTAWAAFSPFLKSQNPISIARSWFPKKYPPVH
jgi:hypothetical protein